MNFSNGLIIKASHNLKHLFMAIFPTFRITFRLMVGTEPAIVNTLIGRFNMKITVEKCKIAIMPSSHNTGKQAKNREISIFKKEKTVRRGYTDIAVYLISDQPEISIGYLG
jgi:hypothetical protein